ALTSTSVVSSLNPSTYGQSVTFTATVTNTSSSLAPAGTVDFWDDGSGTSHVTHLGFGTVGTSSGATTPWTLVISTLGAGTHNIEADFTDGSSFQSSDGTVTQTVNQRAVNLTGSRTYDGTTAANFSILSVSNAVSGDTV